MQTTRRCLLWAMCVVFSVQVIAGEAVTYYHTDLIGSPVAATDQAGYVRWRAAYRPYGDRDQTVAEQLASADSEKGFTGHVYDEETGLTYAGARYYDPALGRFLSADPVGFDPENEQSFGRYTYANNNPYGYVDPDGELTLVAVGVLIIAAVVSIAVIDQINRHPHELNPAQIAYDRWTSYQETLMYNGSDEGGDSGEDKKPNLVDPEAAKHILDGDDSGSGGGHRAGTGRPGKSEFPADWSDDKILGEVSDVATDPKSTVRPSWGGRTVASGTRDGVDIDVVISDKGRIITGFPTNTPRNPPR